MKTVTLRGGEIRDPAGVHDAFARALDFPAWYGRNFDALYDLLTQPDTAAVVVLKRRMALRRALGRETYGTLVRLLRSAAAENPNLRLR